MDRRRFLRDAASTLLVLPFGTFLIHCSSDDQKATSPLQPDNGPPDAPPRLDGDNLVCTSNRVNSHSHSFAIPQASLEAPPADGVTGDTTNTQGHKHTFEIPHDALVMVATGQAVKLITGNASGHAHTFTITKVQ